MCQSENNLEACLQKVARVLFLSVMSISQEHHRASSTSGAFAEDTDSMRSVHPFIHLPVSLRSPHKEFLEDLVTEHESWVLYDSNAHRPFGYLDEKSRLRKQCRTFTPEAFPMVLLGLKGNAVL